MRRYAFHLLFTVVFCLVLGLSTAAPADGDSDSDGRSWTRSSGLPPILPQPLGGVPNHVVADREGKFVFHRKLNFCPMEPQNGSVPLAIDVAKHIDGGNTYGGVPEVPLQVIRFIDPVDGQIFPSQGVGAGMMTVDQGVVPLLIRP